MKYRLRHNAASNKWTVEYFERGLFRRRWKPLEEITTDYDGFTTTVRTFMHQAAAEAAARKDAEHLCKLGTPDTIINIGDL